MCRKLFEYPEYIKLAFKKGLEKDKRLAVEVLGGQSTFDKAFERVKEIMIDGFEVPIERDKDKWLQAEDYSGKKMSHQVLCESDKAGREIYVGKLKAGRSRFQVVQRGVEWVEV